MEQRDDPGGFPVAAVIQIQKRLHRAAQQHPHRDEEQQQQQTIQDINDKIAHFLGQIHLADQICGDVQQKIIAGNHNAEHKAMLPHSARDDQNVHHHR